MDRQERIRQAKRRHLIKQAKERHALKASGNKTEAPVQDEPGLGMKALDYAGRGLDYVGGFGRLSAQGLADLYNLSVGNPTISKADDWKNTIKGKGASSEELMGRMNIPEGASVDLPFLGETSVRDVGGFALDTALDPLTYLSLGSLPAIKNTLKHGGKAGKAMVRGSQIIKKPFKKTGEKIYKSGFKKVDEALEAKGKKALSEIMLEKGVTGTNKKIQKKAVKMADDLMDKRNKLFTKVDDLGGNVDLSKVADDVIDSTSKLRKNPLMKETADKLDEMSMKLMEKGKVSVSDASKIKSDLYDSLPASAYNSFGQLKKPVQTYTKKLANSLKNAVEKGAEQAKKGSGNTIKKINEDLGSLLSGAKPLQKEVAKGNTKNIVSSVDAAMAAYNPAMLAAKKAGDLGKTTLLRTKAGKGLIDLGESGLGDIGLRSLIMDRQEPTKKVNPWR